jgi:broad-specificity NMP kinase
MARLTLITGLPGSGKTMLAGELADYATHVVDDITDLGELPEDDGEDIIITDVNWCDPDVLRRAQTMLKLRYPHHIMDVVYFRNEPEQCRRNVEYRNDGRFVEGTIRRFAPIYNPPKSAYPVWRPTFSKKHLLYDD